ncbi:hypothetical protein [Streptomyces sp. RerS4]|uniref:hypothetical protein n=1 Tax=Streptomyces sp. RerS4 TaxID=2942449 RepID=UPI00201BEEA2|nr:hypothetical protein [Streptomyces sp. RerS4]UQX03467.1 hypothetical protein M4D82_25490 [Streptomyces sp. RerS4]
MRWRRRRADPCAAIAAGLHIPHPFDLSAFCEGLAAQRGRPLVLLPLDGPPQPDLPCGIWIGLDSADLVFYEQSASDLLRIQIILHEISHMLLGHVAPQPALPEDATEAEAASVAAHFEQLVSRTAAAVTGRGDHALAADLVRAEADRLQESLAAPRPGDEELDLSGSRILSLLGRTKFDSDQEQAAETLATLVLERISRVEGGRATSERAADVIHRLNDAFAHPARTHRNR